MWRGTDTPSCKEGRDRVSPDTALPQSTSRRINGLRDGDEVINIDLNYQLFNGGFPNPSPA